MYSGRSGENPRVPARRWWPVALLAGLGLCVAAVTASAATGASQASEFPRTQLSTRLKFAAYPDVAVGDDGLVVAVWTEGSGGSTEKHVGPLYLRWMSNSTSGWRSAVTVDSGQVYDAAVAVSGSTVHLVWSRDKTTIRYATCSPPNYACASAQVVATASVDEALQVDIALDGDEAPHVVWVEDDNEGWKKVYYARKPGATWGPKGIVGSSTDSEGPAIAYANGFLHTVWTEWIDPDHAHTDSTVRYCRSVVGGTWACIDDLSDWPATDYLARNLSIAADSLGNVYVAWDVLLGSGEYAIGYRHATHNGQSWKEAHLYPRGLEEPTEPFEGVDVFASGEGTQRDEYVRFLRPQLSLAVSDTQQVPVLTWHAQVSSDGGEERLAQASAAPVYKVLWTYATRSGSYVGPSEGTGLLYWAPYTATLSTDLCGEVDLSVDSATARLAVVGDLRQVIDGGTPGGDDHLHVIYHEETGGGAWGVFYNSNVRVACLKVYLPLIRRNASGSGEG
jgi:hypothetical protein